MIRPSSDVRRSSDCGISVRRAGPAGRPPHRAAAGGDVPQRRPAEARLLKRLSAKLHPSFAGHEQHDAQRSAVATAS